MAKCARPGCGHERDAVEGDVGQAAFLRFGHDLDGCHAIEPFEDSLRRCPCPGYRTPEQQAAWEYLQRVREWDQASPEGKLAELETAVQCLLEVNP